MSRLNRDFFERYADLERRVRVMEQTPGSYMESVIVGGEFDSTTVIPPFFTPFGGAIVHILCRTVSGNVDVDIIVDSIVIATLNYADSSPPEREDIDPPIYVTEGSTVEVDIVGSDNPSFGLSVGVIIHP